MGRLNVIPALGIPWNHQFIRCLRSSLQGNKNVLPAPFWHHSNLLNMTVIPEDSSKNSCKVFCAPEKRTDLQQELVDIMYQMDQAPDLQGMSSLGADGVLRSWDADRNVIDAVPLTPELITAYFETGPPCEQEGRNAMNGVDGRDVPEERWFNPPKHLIPPPLAEEHREKNSESLEEYRRLYYKRRADLGLNSEDKA